MMASREAFPFSAEGPRMKWKSGQGLKTSDPPEFADVSCPTAFVKIAVCFLSLREAAKFSRWFLHAVTINLAVTTSERI
jgi:hypothetical protein